MFDMHCVKSVRIRSHSGPHFPAFGLKTERYFLSLRIQSECGKMRTIITPNTDTFYSVMVLSIPLSYRESIWYYNTDYAREIPISQILENY